MSYRFKRKQKINTLHSAEKARHSDGTYRCTANYKKHYYTNPKGQIENTANIYIHVYTFTYFMFLKSLMHIVISFE